MVGIEEVLEPSSKDTNAVVEVAKPSIFSVSPLEQAAAPFAVITDKISKYCQTNRHLLATIDDGLCTSEQLNEILVIFTNTLFYGTHSYRPPSAASRKTVQDGKVRWRSKGVAVHKTEQEFVVKISEDLQLDELQSFDLFRSYLHDTSLEQGEAFAYDDDGFQAIKNMYYMERYCLLHTIIMLLRNTMLEDHVFHKQSRDFIQSLITQGLDDLLLNQFVDLAEDTPLHMRDELGAQHMLEEMITLLCALFLIYYNDSPRAVDKFAYLIKVFKEMGFGERVSAADYSYIPQVAQLIDTLKNMCVMVALVAMQLEDIQEEEKLQKHPFIENMEEIKAEIFKEVPGHEWRTVDAHGPVLLAWSLWEFAAAKVNNIINFSHEMTQMENALQSGAISYLTDMLKYGLDKDDIAIIGYKSVVKGLTSAILVLFSEDVALWQTVPIFKLYCLANENTTPLTYLFWDADLHDPILGGWARQATRTFPMQSAPLLQMMKAMSSDVDTAYRAYAYIENMTSYATEKTPQIASSIQVEDEQYALALAPFRIPLFISPLPESFRSSVVESSGFTIQPNTRGEVSTHDMILWSVNYDGWSWVLSNLTNLSTNLKRRLTVGSDEYETALATFSLISHLMSLDDEITHRFFSMYDGMLPKLLPNFVLDCVYYKQPLPLSAAALNCAHYIAKTCNVVMIWRRLSPNVFQMIRTTMRDLDAPPAHPVTLSVLRLIHCVVKRSVQQERQNAEPEVYVDTAASLQPSEMEEALNFCNEIFTSFSGWIYSSVEEKWQIGVKAMKIYYKVLTYYAPSGLQFTDDPNNLRVHRSVLMRILTNKDTQRTLMSIISLGVETFERLPKHRAELESFVLHALALVDTALTRLPSDQVTTLEDALFDANRLDCIAGFSRYRKNAEITVRALRILTQASRTKMPLSTYISDMGKLRVSWLSSLLTSAYSVRFHILAILSSILQHQPSMIIALCSKKGSEVPLPTDGTTIGRREEESKNSLSKVILQLLQAKLMDSDPQVQVCSEMCRLIYFMWKYAANLDVVQDLRANKQFWDYLVEIVMSHHAGSAFNTSARAWALLVISQELLAPKHIAQGSFATIANSATQNLWIANNIPTNLTGEFDQYKPNNGFESLPVITSTFDLDKVYGDRYFYDVSRLESKATPEKLVDRIKEANNWLSKADAHSFFLRAWSTFLYSSMKHHSGWFLDAPDMALKISSKVREALSNDIPLLSLVEGVAPLFLVACKLVPKGTKVEGKILATIFSDQAVVFRRSKNINPDTLSHLCTALVLLIRNVELNSGTWRDAELTLSNEYLVDSCWALVETDSVKLRDSIFCLLGSLLRATQAPMLILNTTKQPSLLVLMSVFAKALYKEECASHVENILSFVMQLATDPDSASALLSDGLLNVLCSRNAPFFAQFSHPAYTKTDTRNAWHRVWCACITVVAQLLRTLQFTDEAPRRAMEFVNTHSDKLWEALNPQNKELKYGVLEETEKTLQLFKELAVFTNRWKFAPSDFANKWGMCIVRLVHFLVSVFSAENGVKTRLSSSRDPVDSAAGEVAKEALLLSNIVNCLFFLQLSGPQIPRLLSAQGNPGLLAAEVDSVTHIFSPSSDLFASSPSLGILIYAIHHSFRALKSTSNNLPSTSSAPSQFSPRHLSPSLFAIIELSLTLLLSHILYFLHKLDIRAYPEQVQQVHVIGEDMVHSLHNYLVDLSSSGNFEESELLMIKYYFMVLAHILRVSI